MELEILVSSLEAFPHEWDMKRLAAVVSFSRKPSDVRLLDSGPIPFIPMEVIPNEGLHISQPVYKEPASIASGVFCRSGDILLAKITPSFENGKQAILDNVSAPFAMATTEVFAIAPNTNALDKYFLFYFFKLPQVRTAIAARMEGTTGRQRVPKHVIENVLVPLPPLPEQRRIAAVLNAVQEVIAAQDDLIAAARAFKRSLMHRLFTYGPARQPAETKQTEIGEAPVGWHVSQLGSVCTVRSGTTPSREVASYWKNGTIPWVKTGEINYRRIVATEERVTQEALDETSLKIIPQGTLLTAMYGQGITRGRVAILDIPATINQACAAITPTDSGLHTEYLYHYLTYQYERLRSVAHGAHQKNLSASLLAGFLIAYPTISVQASIVDTLNAVDAKIAAEEDCKTALQALFRSLLHQLMTGQLRLLSDEGLPLPA